MFDQDDGRIIYFEGTYATTFSGNPDPTPRYDYNQMMYQLDLSDPRLSLPVPIYEFPSGSGSTARLAPRTVLPDGETWTPHRVAFFAPEREGIAWLPVYEQADPRIGQVLHVAETPQKPGHEGVRPLFYVLPADIKDLTGATTPLYEYAEKEGNGRFYSVDAPAAAARALDLQGARPGVAQSGAPPALVK